MVIWVLVCGKVQGSSEGNRARFEFSNCALSEVCCPGPSLLTLPILATHCRTEKQQCKSSL